MKLQFLGGNRRVGGSCTVLTLPNNKKILIDYGIIQDKSLPFGNIYDFNSKEFDFDINDITHTIITHAHLDHIGKLPLLFKRGYKGKVLATEPTGKLASINLKDSAFLMTREIERQNKRNKQNKYKELYSIEEADYAAKSIQCYSYYQKIYLSKDIYIEFIPNGHMIGSAMVKLNYTEDEKQKTILFAGDTSGFTEKHPFIKKADKIGDVNSIIIESTYGSRYHTQYNMKEELDRIITRTCIDNKRTLLLPVFSIQRSTELLQIIYEITKNKEEFKDIPVFLDSPMAICSTKVIESCKDFWCDNWKRKSENQETIFENDFASYSKNVEASIKLANGDPKIILSSSGMMQGGRILHHLQSFLPSKDCTILFTGYCGEGTLSHKILNTKCKSVSVMGRQVKIRADIESLPFSSHADQNELVEFLKSSNKEQLENIFLVHGDQENGIALRNRLKKVYGNRVKISIPEYEDKIKL